MEFLNLAGKRFSKLVAIRRTTRPKGVKPRGTYWLCICTCGQFTKVRLGALRSKRVRSCGCNRRTIALRNLKHHTIRVLHGHARVGQLSPEFTAYVGARGRCCNKKNPAYKNYGGRGILFSFTSFLDFLNALKTPSNPSGLKPSPAHSLDRVNNDGPYAKGNIKWSTSSEQNNNRRPNRKKVAQ